MPVVDFLFFSISKGDNCSFLTKKCLWFKGTISGSNWFKETTLQYIEKWPGRRGEQGETAHPGLLPLLDQDHSPAMIYPGALSFPRKEIISSYGDPIKRFVQPQMT